MREIGEVDAPRYHHPMSLEHPVIAQQSEVVVAWHLRRYIDYEVEDDDAQQKRNGTYRESSQLGFTATELLHIGPIALGLSQKEVAHSSGVSESAVKNHRSSIYRKVNARNGAHATRILFEAGLLDKIDADRPMPANVTRTMLIELEFASCGYTAPMSAKKRWVEAGSVREVRCRIISFFDARNMNHAVFLAMKFGILPTDIARI